MLEKYLKVFFLMLGLSADSLSGRIFPSWVSTVNPEINVLGVPIGNKNTRIKKILMAGRP